MELTQQQWETVKKLFESALEKAPDERDALLAAATQDSLVRREVERLLAHHVESGGFFSSPVFSAAVPVASSSVQAFVPGDLAADRFRIARFIARGGMGEVYEAEDIELHERVALKSIRGELLQDAKALERFKREVHLSRKVTHPNVCRIFDLFRQSPSTMTASTRGAIVFVAMELLEGETLAEFLQKHLRLQADEAAPIASQMASGLGAAHAAGILHRDFKPGNVLLVPGAKGVRAVITDFGLALRANPQASLGAPVTGAGELLGTPAYMSPEQVENKELTPASDVYSLGLVLYQMVTGTRPFEEATPLATAVRRIKEDPIPPRNLVPDLDPRWESLILRCLARNPKDRFQNGDEVVEALRGESKLGGTKLGETKPGEVGTRLDRRILLGSAALLLVSVGSVFYYKTRHKIPGPAPTPLVSVRPSVAVLPFHNLSGRSDTEWVSTALPEMLTAELTAGGKLRTSSGENITRASADLRLTGKQTLARDTLEHVRKYLGSDYVVLGSYLDQGSSEPQIRVDLWLQDTKTGETAATISEKGGESDLDSLATRAGADLRRTLGVGDVTPNEAAVVRAALPSNPEAVRLYSEGLARLRLLNAPAARDELERAVAADPNYALGHAALAEAWQAMGYDQRAQEESKKARDLSSGLSREERLWIEAKDWELNRRWDKAVEIYRTLYEFFPDNLEYGLRLSNAQALARTIDEALATLQGLRKLPSPDGDDPRILLQQAVAYEMRGAYKEQQAAAESAASRARELGATLLLARALNQEARAFEAQGKPDDALRSAEEAARISSSAGGRLEVARALTVTGIVRYDQGNFAEAASANDRALAIQEEIGYKRGAATTLNNLANVRAAQGDLSGSMKLLNEALETFREIGDKHSAAAVLNNMATRTYRQGQLEKAKKMLEQVLTTTREIGDQQRESMALYNLGEVLRWQGDLKGADKMYEHAEDLSKQIGDQSGVAYALSSLGDVLTAEDELPAAREKYNQSLAMRTQMGEKGNGAETQMALDLLLIEEGHAGEAENSLREVENEFHSEGLTVDEILAHDLLARVLLVQKKAPDAEEEIAAARNFLPKSQDFSVRLRTLIAEAQVEAAAGKSEDAVRLLQKTIASAKKSGYEGLRLEAELALSETEVASGRAAAGMDRLADVRKQAQEKGFRLIANKAAQASAKSSAQIK
jgi:eukaryotic-like serine/threonine-protein kinase